MLVFKTSFFLMFMGLVFVQSMPLEETSAKPNTVLKKRTGNSLNKPIFQMSNRHRRANEGIVYRRGDHNLPLSYSGNMDFAFDDDSFKSSKFVTPTEKQNRNPIWNNNNISPYPPNIWQNNQNNNNDAVITWPEEEKKIIDWDYLFIPKPNQNSVNPTTSSNNIENSNNGSTTNGSGINPCQRICLRTRATNEYSPICGSDNVTYKNRSSFLCATSCGKQITGRPDRTCGFGRPVV